MTTVTAHVHVKASRATTFEHLVAFEAYPEFVKSIHRVSRDPDHDQRVEFAWTLAGVERTYRVDVLLDRPAAALYWRSVDGPEHAGTAAITEVTPRRSALTVKVELRPSGALDRVGSATGVLRGRLEHHLHQFAAYVEERVGRRPTRDAADYRAPSEKLFDAVFPTDETIRGR